MYRRSLGFKSGHLSKISTENGRTYDVRKKMTKSKTPQPALRNVDKILKILFRKFNRASKNRISKVRTWTKG